MDVVAFSIGSAEAILAGLDLAAGGAVDGAGIDGRSQGEKVELGMMNRIRADTGTDLVTNSGHSQV